jgi:serine/threonine-protein kinase
MLGRIFLGRYETIRLLGEGGMGRVYLARQVDLGRQVVVKVMHDHIASDPKFRDRFQRETLLMARFQHPYVVTLYDASLSDPEGPCIVMEYIRGVSLDTLLHRNGRFSPQRMARLLGQLCEALQAAHTEGIVHRDLKPANLMVVDADTPYEKMKVMDFGLAKMVSATPCAKMPEGISDTNLEFAVGTPGYISPEQVRGDGMDHRSDLYSLGVIMYELLTGRLPFTGAETMDVLLAHATEAPPSFAEVGLSGLIPASIEDVVNACLAKSPDDRPQSARDLYDRYENALFQEQLSGSRLYPTFPPADGSTPMPVAGAAPAQPAASANGRPASNGALASTPIPTQPQIPYSDDPSVVIHHLEAWMPESIAVYKLRGFVNDVGGQVVESVPGKIRVRLGGRHSIYELPATGSMSWLGIGRRNTTLDMELLLQRNNPQQQSLLTISVVMRPPDKNAAATVAWRRCCSQIFCDLRAYLMGQGVAMQS